jgi:histidyl-tRNA synthetase
VRQPLPGFRDFYPPECWARNYIFQKFRRITHRFGYEEFDGPVLEPLDLFTDKSGPEIAEQLFSFCDRGGRPVALRPEMTPLLARMVGARAPTLKRPIRWCNVGENFRYERPQKGRLRSFYQMNCDILGETNARADGEVMLLLLHILRSFGLGKGDFVLRLSDRRLWTFFLAKFALDGAAMALVLGAIDKMDREPAAVTVEKLQAIAPGREEQIFGEIIKLRSCKTVEDLGEFFSNFPGDGPMKRLGDWKILWEFLVAGGCEDFVTVDLGIVRGLAYYTGFVFEAFEREGETRALAGGGRYDDLVEKLGGGALPAVGFAIGDVTLSHILREKELLPAYKNGPDIFLVFPASAQKEALDLCNDLRGRDWWVSYDLDPTNSPGKQLKRAAKVGARAVVFLANDGMAPGKYRIRNLETGITLDCSRGELEEKLEAISPAAGWRG